MPDGELTQARGGRACYLNVGNQPRTAVQALHEGVYLGFVLVFGEQLDAAIEAIPDHAPYAEPSRLPNDVGAEADALHMAENDSANRVHLICHSTW